MATKTTNYQFVKPEGTDALLPDAFNDDLDAIDKELKSVNDAVEAVANKVGNADTTLEEVATKLSEHETKLTEHSTALSNVQTKLTEHDTKLSELEEKIGDGGIDEAELTKIKSKLSEHDTSIAELNEKIADIDTTPRNIATLAEVLEILGTVNEPIDPAEPDTPDVPDTTDANIFGVMWDSSNSSTALTRLTKDSDPYKLVTQNVDAEPVPAVGNGEGSSPFDSFAPWSGMKKCNLDTSGAVTAWQEDAAFYFGNDYTMVYIPAFWIAAKTDGSKKYFYISDKAVDGMTKHPGSGKYVGRYANGESPLYSRSIPVAPDGSINRATARSRASANGEKFHLYDYVTYCAIAMLYLVEYADWDSQAKIGIGRTSSESDFGTNGLTNSMTYHTGEPADHSAVQYRWIENPWGNICQWIDGINVDGSTVYYCDDPSKYADDTAEGYTWLGAMTTGTGYMKNINVTENGLLYPTEAGGAEHTYIPDYVGYLAGWTGVCVGGHKKDGSYAGLLAFEAGVKATTSYATVSARLECEA